MAFDDDEQDGKPKLPSIDDLITSGIFGGRNTPTPAIQRQPTLDAAMRVNDPAAQPEQPKPDMTDQAMRAPMPTGAPQSGMTQLNDVANMRPNIPAPPLNPNTPSLMKEKAAISTPIDRRDPQYRMGTGQRVLGTVANFLNGASRNGVAPVEVGPGANNNKYYRDEEARQGKVGGLNSQIADNEKLDEMNRQAFQTATTSQYHEDLAKARQDTAAAQGESASARTALADEKARSDKANEARKSQEDANTPAPNARPSLQKNPATGKMELMVKTKGGGFAPYTPKTVEEGAMLGDPTAKAMFYYQHRKGGGKDEENPELNGMSAAESRDFKAATRQNDLKMKSLMDARRDALLIKPDSVGDIDKQVADLQAERDQIRDGIVARRPKGGKVAAAAAEKANTNPQTGRKVGDVVNVGGKSIKITKILPGGKYEGAPAQ
jgi:hypothetical protein